MLRFGARALLLLAVVSVVAAIVSFVVNFREMETTTVAFGRAATGLALLALGLELLHRRHAA